MIVTDYSGQKFDKLLVTNKSESRVVISKNKKTINRLFWLCVCDCGNEIWIESRKLKRAKYNHCGECVVGRPAKILPNGGAAKNDTYKQYIRGANKRGLSFSLTKEEFINLVTSNCFYCGREPYTLEKKRNKIYYNSYFIRNGIDRLNNDIGYEKNNCVSCCKKCNFAKLNYSIEEFKETIIKIYNHWIREKSDI